MTRSDLINSLVGSRLSSKAITAAKALDIQSSSKRQSKSGGNNDEQDMKEEIDEEEDGESSSDSEDDSTTDDTDSDDDEEEEEDSSDEGQGPGIHRKIQQNSSDGNNTRKGNHPQRVPCQAEDIGGFYAALCALGEQVEIGTKVRSWKGIACMHIHDQTLDHGCIPVD